MNYLFLFSLGPVQSFISQARKTQDLYAGSKILSDLCQIGFEKALSMEGAKPVFPFDVKSESLPNRFIVRMDKTLEKEEQRAIGQQVESAVRNGWLKTAEERIKEHVRNVDFEIFKPQIEHHLEVYWLFFEIGADYAASFQEAEKAMGAVKNIRMFTQNIETGRKCSLDGERNVKFYRLTAAEEEGKVIKSKLFLKNGKEVYVDKNKLRSSLLQPGEGLSAVSFVKRAYFKEGSFPSTAEIALMREADRLSDKDRHLLECYKNLFDEKKWPEACVELINKKHFSSVDLEFGRQQEDWNTDFDFQYLYEENLTDKNLPNLVQRQIVKAIQRKLADSFKSKYYAILQFDGDRMGKILGGGFLSENSQSELERFQNRASELLSQFAQKAKSKILRHPDGRTVYAGGDDFLGLVNLESLFTVMEHLRSTFDKDVNEVLKTEFKNKLTSDYDFTISAGIAVAHYKTPLGVVLQKAREMERKAKDAAGRDAFSIAVLKHSGESHEACLKWDNLGALKKIDEQLSKKNFSKKFIVNLEKEFGYFKGDVEDSGKDYFKNSEFGRAMLETRIGCLVNRAKTPAATPGDVSHLSKTVFEVFNHKSNPDFENFSDILNIVEFINRQTASDQ